MEHPHPEERADYPKSAPPSRRTEVITTLQNRPTLTPAMPSEPRLNGIAWHKAQSKWQKNRDKPFPGWPESSWYAPCSANAITAIGALAIGIVSTFGRTATKPLQSEPQPAEQPRNELRLPNGVVGQLPWPGTPPRRLIEPARPDGTDKQRTAIPLPHPEKPGQTATCQTKQTDGQPDDSEHKRKHTQNPVLPQTSPSRTRRNTRKAGAAKNAKKRNAQRKPYKPDTPTP